MSDITLNGRMKVRYDFLIIKLTILHKNIMIIPNHINIINLSVLTCKYFSQTISKALC